MGFLFSLSAFLIPPCFMHHGVFGFRSLFNRPSSLIDKKAIIHRGRVQFGLGGYRHKDRYRHSHDSQLSRRERANRSHGERQLNNVHQVEIRTKLRLHTPI